MKIKIQPPRTALIVMATAVLSATSIFTCGAAAAHPLEEWLQILVRQAGREMPRTAAPDIMSQGRGLLEPVTTAAGEDSTKFTSITKAACRANTVQHAGNSVDDYLENYPAYQRPAIMAQLDRFDDYNANGSYQLVALTCKLALTK
jgi:hypothetical protein